MKLFLKQGETTTKCLKMKEELLPKIIVKDPVTHDSWEQGKFTTYLVCVKTEHPAFHLRLSAVRRRFSELRWLYKILRTNHTHVHFPKPPSKKIFAERFELAFINSRMLEIQSFLNELMVTDTVLSDAAFHFFLQTDLTTDEIEEHLNGTLSETIVKDAWNNAGHLHTSSYIVNTTTFPHEPKEIIMNEEDLQHSQQHSLSLDSSYSHSSFENSTSCAPLVVLKTNGAFFVPETSDTLSISETNDAHSVAEISGTVSTSETSDPLSAPESNDPLSAPETSSLLSAPETSDQFSAPESSNTLSVPETSGPLSAPETSDPLSAQESSNTLSAPETSGPLSAPESSNTLSAPETNNSLSAPEIADTLSVPETSDALCGPETDDSLCVPETSDIISAPDRSDLLSVPRASDVLSDSPAPTTVIGDETDLYQP